jgi:hypothetical protein
VRDYLAEGKGSAWVKLTTGREDGASSGGPVTRRGHEAEERKEGVRSRGR